MLSRRLWNFYPRPPRGGRLLDALTPRLVGYISIHALREEGDAAGSTTRAAATDFYPRPPRGGRPGGSWGGFLGTGISIHALREEGDMGTKKEPAGQGISIHALREEGDNSFSSWVPLQPRFLSTPSARRAT